MATKTKTKPRSGTKKGNRRKAKASGPFNVGIISSIPLTTTLKNAIVSGGCNLNVYSIEDNLGYEQPTIEQYVREFSKDNNIDVIITVGGGVTYTAAEAAAQKMFVSVVGVAPTKQGPFCYGGVDLRSADADEDRANHLGSKGNKKIGLYYNPASAMAPYETAGKNWSLGPAYPSSVNMIDYDPTAFSNDFGTISAAVTGLIISADPFFQSKMDHILDAARASKLYVCYPLQDYGNGKTKPKSKYAALWGPPLTDAYCLVGMLARNAFVNNVRSGFVPTLDISTDIT